MEDGLQQARDVHADGRPAMARWGSEAGSVFLAVQQVPILVPRVRNRATSTEVPVATYAQLQPPSAQDVGLCRRVLGELSCRDYEAAVEAVPEASARPGRPSRGGSYELTRRRCCRRSTSSGMTLPSGSCSFEMGSHSPTIRA